MQTRLIATLAATLIKGKQMTKNLTVKSLENLKPVTSRREVPDGGVSGLYHVTQPSGVQSWVYRFRFHGRSCKWTIGRFPEIDLGTARTAGRMNSRTSACDKPGWRSNVHRCARRNAPECISIPEAIIFDLLRSGSALIFSLLLDVPAPQR